MAKSFIAKQLSFEIAAGENVAEQRFVALSLGKLHEKSNANMIHQLQV